VKSSSISTIFSNAAAAMRTSRPPRRNDGVGWTHHRLPPRSGAAIDAIVTAFLADVASTQHREMSCSFLAIEPTRLTGPTYNSLKLPVELWLVIAIGGRFLRRGSTHGGSTIARPQSLPSRQSQPNCSSIASDYCVPTRGWLNQM
jgi:hypothetical protein